MPKSETINTQVYPVQLLLCFVIAFIVFLSFLPALFNDFTNWDDDLFVLDNYYVHSFNRTTITWMFTNWQDMKIYAPLTWISHTVDYQIWGLNPLGHHLTSVVLHVLNTVLVFLIATQLIRAAYSPKGNPSIPTSSSEKEKRNERFFIISALLTSLFFGLHPLRVESVTWIAERKDVLSSFFFLLTILIYLVYTRTIRETASSGRKVSVYGAMLFVYLLALFSKPMAVTLPFVLILIDIFPLKRLSIHLREWLKPPRTRILLEKVPFLIISLPFVIIALLSEGEAGGGSAFFLTSDISHILDRVMIGFRGLAFYLYKTLLPLHLIPLYPTPSKINPLQFQFLGSVAIVIAVTAITLLHVQRYPALFISWAYYLIVLLPVAGFIPFGVHTIADRFSYLPMIGPTILFGSGLGTLVNKTCEKKKSVLLRALLLGGLGLLLACLISLTIRQNLIWRNSITLWSHQLKYNPDEPKAQNNYGVELFHNGQIDEALVHLSRAVEIDPDYAAAQSSYGIALFQKGKVHESLEYLRRAVEIDSEYAIGYTNLGIALFQTGKKEEGLNAFRKTLLIDPHHPQALNNLGHALDLLGKTDQALPYLHKAVEIKPGFPEALNNLGNVYIKKGDYKTALTYLQKAIKYNPSYLNAYVNLAAALEKNGNIKEAVNTFTRALQIQPTYAPFHKNYADFLLRNQQPENAVGEYKEALRLNPKDIDTAYRLAYTLARNGKELDRAKALAQRLLSLDPNNPHFLMLNGIICFQQRRYSEALKTFRNAKQRFEKETIPYPPDLDEFISQTRKKITE